MLEDECEMLELRDITDTAEAQKKLDKMMSDMGICPFTSGPDMSGVMFLASSY